MKDYIAIVVSAIEKNDRAVEKAVYVLLKRAPLSPDQHKYLTYCKNWLDSGKHLSDVEITGDKAFLSNCRMIAFSFTDVLATEAWEKENKPTEKKNNLSIMIEKVKLPLFMVIGIANDNRSGFTRTTFLSPTFSK